MSKLLSILIAAVFAVSTGSVFAAAHMKAAGEKTDVTTKEPVKTEAEMKKAEDKKAAKMEKKAAKKKAKKEKATVAKKEGPKIDEMNKEAQKK